MGKVTVKAYASPTCTLLAFDWDDGSQFPDFLGFAIRRTPGFSKGGKPQFLFNKLDFVPIAPGAKPKPSDQAPIQKFNWWDGGIDSVDRGKTFRYDVMPVLGTGAHNLKLQNQSAGTISVTVPKIAEGKVSTYFNRAVVSSQSFLKLKAEKLSKKMEWLANGLQGAIPDILDDSKTFECAIYHLTDGLWVLPAFEKFKGSGSITYFSKGDDTKSEAGIKYLNKKAKISKHKRDAIRKLMHNKFIISYKGKSAVSVLMGSTNFTPDAQTIQANLLHIFRSPKLAKFYAERATLLAKDAPTTVVSKKSGWHSVDDIPGTKIRVFFTPEPGKKREFLNTVTNAVKGAKSSVLFCMFTASDFDLMKAIFAKGDSPKHLIYGLLNSVDDPEKLTKKGEKRKNLPKIAATIFHRSKQKRPDTLKYTAFSQRAPRGFLPELRTIDATEYDVSKKGKKSGKKHSGPPPIHVHHKFIVIDGDTPNPTIYSGSPNFSAASENSNDENVLEIKGNRKLAAIYVAEFMRLYNHYRARAVWERTHAKKSSTQDPLVLATKRDKWVKDAYRKNTKDFLARTRGL